jgi:hypothetical protein
MNEKFKDLYWAENNVVSQDEYAVIKLSEPRVLVKYVATDDYYENPEQFLLDIKEIRWLDAIPSDAVQKEVLVLISEYIIEEERLLNEFLEEEEE